jgi:hypothetical protein
MGNSGGIVQVSIDYRTTVQRVYADINTCKYDPLGIESISLESNSFSEPKHNGICWYVQQKKPVKSNL